ncbi:MAG: hypothetical protein EP307_05045, partial [Rhodobacteraceae bacterium]
MLTDVFFVRYEQTPLFRSFLKREMRTLHQCFTILEDFHPFWGEVDKEQRASEKFWGEIHNRVANELGVRWLSDPWYQAHVGIGEYRRLETKQRNYIEICRNWYSDFKSVEESIDECIKERLSLVELGMRLKYADAEGCKMNLALAVGPKSVMASVSQRYIEKYETAASELNDRLRSARFPLNYHNGFFQIEADTVISREIEQPFWSLVSEPLWKNVDIDMKEAVDQRDNGGKDPAIFAAKALESTIKVISSELDLTHGGERGAHGFIENLSKNSVMFIVEWERDILKSFFFFFFNQLGHGPC